MSKSNNITAFLNFIAILCSIPIISSGIWLSSKPDNECIHLFKWPLIFIGILILLVALAGFVGAFWNKPCLLVFYLICMSILIVILLGLTVFAFIVTNPDGSYNVPGRGFKEYRLDGYGVSSSNWLKNYVSRNWGKIRRCVVGSDVCSMLTQTNYMASDQFFMASMSPLQSGCCKPPTVCGYGYSNPTLWTSPATNPAGDPDCYTWSNDQTQLCYGCNSCKAGLLGSVRVEWRKVNVFLIGAIVVLIIVYVIACSALKNAQTENIFKRYKLGWT